MLNTRHLLAFAAVATSGSIVRSSERIQRAQSAITRSIQELEKDVGVPLFERRSQGMLPTEFGRALFTRVKRAFLEMDTARAAFEAACPGFKAIAQAPILSLSISPQRLLVFLELVAQRHMGAAAESLGISQPGASQALREIETGVGVKLFTHANGRMQPTPLCALLAMHIGRALAEIRAGEADIAALQAAVTGRVVVGTFSSLGRTRLLPAAIIRLITHYPNLTVSTIEASFEHLTMRLRAGDVDFVLGALRDTESTNGMVRETIVQDVLSLVVGTSHPLARKRRVPLSDLNAVDWVLPQRGSPTRELLESTLRANGLAAPRVAVETSDLTITRGILQGSHMIAAVSAHLYHDEICAGTLAVLPLALPDTRRAIGILQRPSKNPSLAARLLIDHIHAIGEL